ncbi:AIG1-type guanine nucleotide-binding (G) domain [Arabidopsis thaliana x Arabidopsis arenosa]|uniref:AIG1-type G domain-containing protein n=2 Tax=Arabidopsis TaxID=3701 RepID=A0A178UVI4_ARATH|nr:AIG1-type guanine nucleotide-binding (G) domain [Arabidopsis thaliana x Arabidopsis arenosa]OAO98046.1 hypothetical protein AXX17_AT4G11110 [Arabidopsis thaliana]
MGGGLVADDFKTGHDACESYLPMKPSRTLVLIGCSGNGKSATGNSILRSEAFKSKGQAAAVTKECELKSTKRPNGQIINVIDTPGLFSLFPSNESTIREILKCSYLTKEEIDAVLMFFSLRRRLTEEEKSVPFVLKTLFGDSIFDYLIVVFTNEDSLIDDNVTINEYLEGSPDFKEILAACNNRMVLFENRLRTSKRKKAKQVQKLLDLVEEVERKNNNKPFLFDLSHESMESEAVVDEKAKKIRAMKSNYTKQEMSNWKEEEVNLPLAKKVEKVIETTSLLEQKLNQEQNARLEAEKRANKLHEESSEEIKILKEKLERAQKELEKRDQGCIIL